MFLVTTAAKIAWKTDEKILFLGEWCKRYNDKHVWERLDYEVLPYHWDDRLLLHRDFQYLEGVYERYLKTLSRALNNLHQVDRSLRYWRILIGPWLRYFVDILYDRYCSLKAASETNIVEGTWLLQAETTAWVPKDFAQFHRYLEGDGWNHFIYAEIVRRLHKIPYSVLEEWNSPIPDYAGEKGRSSSERLLRCAAGLYARIVPDRLNRVVFVSSYFRPRDLTKIQLSLGQVPYPYAPDVSIPSSTVDITLRDKLKFEVSENEYENLLGNFIPLQIPTTYVEGYQDLRNRSLLSFPGRAEVICTANAYASNEGFKVWAAECVEEGARLLVAQHGGQYGIGLWSQTEDHEIAISDRFFTWGWDQANNRKVKPLSGGALLRARKKIRPDPTGGILWVLPALPRYSYQMYSVPVAGQFLHFLRDQIILGNKVSAAVRKLLRLRLFHAGDYGWDIVARFTDAGIGDLIDYSGKTFYRQLRESRLCIGTYNSTTYLETFVADYPTLMFWNPAHWELRDEARPYFDELRRVGILHDTPESAATLLNEICIDPETWWRQPQVQAARESFCRHFAHTKEHWLPEWKAEIQSLRRAACS